MLLMALPVSCQQEKPEGDMLQNMLDSTLEKYPLAIGIMRLTFFLTHEIC